MKMIEEKTAGRQEMKAGQPSNTNLPEGKEQVQVHNNNNISISGLQVIQAYRTIRKLSVSSTWVKPARPGVWWNAVGFSV